MPLKDRETTQKKVWKYFSKDQKSLDSNFRDRNVRPLFAVVGTPGSGKTRFMAEVLKQPHPSVAAQFQNYMHIHATYNNGNEFVASIDGRNSVCGFALRILYHHFIETTVGERFQDQFRKMFKAIEKCVDVEEFDIPKALQLIREDYVHTNKLGLTAVVTIAIGFDEYNKFLPRDGEALNHLVDALGSAMLTPPPGVRMLLLFAGTSEQGILNAGLGSSFPVKTLRLAPLSEPSSLAIVAEIMSSQNVATHSRLRNMLTDIGGHPRLLQRLVEKLSKYPSLDEVNWDVMTEKLISTVQERWIGVNESKFIENIILQMVQRKQITQTEPVPGSDTITYDAIEQLEMGLRFDKGTPYWPPMYLRTWVYNYDGQREYFRMALSHTLSASSDGEQLFTWQHFERFCAQFLALKIAAFADMTVNVSELFKGALIATNALEGLELSISGKHFQPLRAKAAISDQTFPRKSKLTQNGVEFEWRECHRVVINNEGAPFDFFANVRALGCKNGFFICGQAKYYTTTQLTLETIKEELKKVTQAMKKAHYKHWMLLIVTTGQFQGTASDLPERCAVVSASQFAAFFSRPLADRVHFKCKYCAM